MRRTLVERSATNDESHWALPFNGASLLVEQRTSAVDERPAVSFSHSRRASASTGRSIICPVDGTSSYVVGALVVHRCNLSIIWSSRSRSGRTRRVNVDRLHCVMRSSWVASPFEMRRGLTNVLCCESQGSRARATQRRGTARDRERERRRTQSERTTDGCSE
jgi:hypothetical protein